MSTFLTLLISFVMMMGNPAPIAVHSDDFAGSWSYNVPQAPPQYMEGVVHIEESESGEYTGKVTFKTGGEVPIREIKVDDDTIILRVYVEGSLIDIVCSLEEGMLKGTVLTPEGNLPFTASRVEETPSVEM